MAIQTWRGCTETVSLARLTSMDAPEQTVELAKQSLPHVVVPNSEQVQRRQPGAAQEVSIAQVEDPGIPALSLTATHDRDYPVDQEISSGQLPELRPSEGFARELEDLASMAPVPDALRISLDAPTEIKYRIWIQPMDQPARHKLQRAVEVPCPPYRMLGLEAWTAPLEPSPESLDAALPPEEGFAMKGALEGLVAHDGSALQDIVTVDRVQAPPLLYPGSRRVAIASSV